MKKLLLGLIFSMALCLSCGTSHKVINSYGVTNMVKISKDTVSAALLQKMIEDREIPSLDKCSSSYLHNMEDGKRYKFYTYYDKKTEKMYSIKELKEKSTYVVEVKKVN